MRNKPLIIALLALTQLGCNNEKVVDLTTLTQATHCPIDPVGLSLYKTPEAFAQALKPPPGQLKQNLELQSGTKPLPSIQLPEGSWAVVVNLGQQPSAGYGIELTSTTGRVTRGTLSIELKEHQPAPDSLQAMMITTPCVIVAFDKKGIQRVTAKTQNQQWQQE